MDATTGAGALIKALEDVGCEVIFGMPGGAILPAYDPLLDSVKIRHVLVRHEQGAGHAAQGYAQATGRVGVCMATSGPGATNLVTPLADAYMDSVPIVAITGQVSRSVIGTDAFQEADIRSITLPITKHSFQVHRPRRHPESDRGGVLARAQRQARPGTGGHPQGRALVEDDLHAATAAGAQHHDPPGPLAGADPQRRPADRDLETPGVLRGRGSDPRGRRAGTAPARRRRPGSRSSPR